MKQRQQPIRMALYAFLFLFMALFLRPETACADSGSVTLTVNGSTEEQDLLSSESFLLTVDAPGATGIKIWNAGHWEYRRGSFVEEDWWSYGSGTYRVYAQVTYDDLGSGPVNWESQYWEISSNRVTLNVISPYGTLGQPVYHLQSPSVERGEYLVVVIDETQGHNEWYRADVILNEGTNNEQWINHAEWEEETRTILIPTVNLSQGTYSICVGNDAVGWDNNGIHGSFTVTENSPHDGVMMQVSKTQIVTHENIQIQVFAQDAERVEIRCVQVDEGSGWHDGQWRGGSFGNWGWSVGHTGTFEITPVAYWRDAQGNETEAEGDPVEVTVVSNGVLPQPVIRIPAVVRRGEIMDGYLEEIPGADGYNVDLHYIDDYGEWHFLQDYRYELRPDDDGSGQIPFSFPAEAFAAAGTYRIWASVWGYGLEGNGREIKFQAVDDVPGSHDVLLKVNGNNGETGELNVLSSEDLQIEVSAPGATAVRVYNRHHWDYWGDWEGYDRWTWGFGSGQVTIVAQATYEEYDEDQEGFRWEDLNWSATSNGVQLNLTNPYGRLDPPAVHLEQNTVTRGDYLTAVIDQTQGQDEWYWADVLIDVDEDYWDNHADWYPDTGCILIPTINLPPGSYSLSVGNDAVGYEENNTWLDFSVEDTDARTDVMLQVTRTELVIGEDTRISVYADNADWVEARIVQADEGADWNDGRQRGGSFGSWNFSFGHTGTFEITPVGHGHDGNGNETVTEGDPVTVTVSSNGRLDEPIIHIAPVITFGDEVTGYIDAVEGAEGYNIDLHYLPEQGDWEYLSDYDLDPADNGQGQIWFTFPAELFRVPGTYRVGSRTWAYGMEGNGIGNRFVVSDNIDENTLTLSVNGNTDEAYVLAGEDFQIEVSAPGATAVRVYRDRWDYWDQDEIYIGKAWDTWSFGPGLYSLVAQAIYDDEYDPDDDDFRWEDLNWSVTSNGVRVQADTPYGKLERPTISVPDQVTRGSWLTLHIDPLDGAEHYNVWIDGLDENGQWYDTFFDEYYDNAGDISIPTWGFEPGIYGVQVEASGTGYWSDDIEDLGYLGFFEVLDSSSEGISFSIDKTQVTTREPYTVSIYAPGADRVRFCHERFDWRWRESEGESLTGIWDQSRAGEWEYLAFATYDDGETWVQADESITVEVTAPNGELDSPTISGPVPANLQPGQDLNFTYSAVENAEEYYIAVQYDLDDEYIVDKSCRLADGETQGSFTVPAEYLTEGRGYYITVTAEAKPGYSSSDAKYEFTVLSGNVSGVRLFMDKTELLCGESTNFLIAVNGHDQVEDEDTFRLFVNGNQDRSWDESSNNLISSDWFWWNGSGTLDVCAKALIGGRWIESNHISVTVTSLGRLEAPEQTFPDYFLYGEEPFEFSFEGVPQDDVWYKIVIYDETYDYTIANYDFGEPGTYTNEDIEFDEDEYLEPGHIYSSDISVWKVGYEPGWTDGYRTAAVDPDAILDLPSGLEEIGEEAFADIGAQMVRIPDGVTTLCPGAFQDCRNLIAVLIPSSVTDIAEDAFEDCAMEPVFSYE